MESRGLMLFTHRNHEGEVDLVGTLAAHAGLHQLPENAMHRFAVGDSQRIHHRLFAELGVRMVDGKSVRLQFYSRDCGGVGLAGCGKRGWYSEVRSGVHVEIPLARGLRARFGHAQAIVRRRGPVRFQLWVRI